MRKFILGALCLSLFSFHQVKASGYPDASSIKVQKLGYLFETFDTSDTPLSFLDPSTKFCENISNFNTESGTVYSCEDGEIVSINSKTGVKSVFEFLNPKVLLGSNNVDEADKIIKREFFAPSDDYVYIPVDDKGPEGFRTPDTIKFRSTAVGKDGYWDGDEFRLPTPFNDKVKEWILRDLFGNLDIDTKKVIGNALAGRLKNPNKDDYLTHENDGIGAVIQTVIDGENVDNVSRRILVTTNGKDFNGFQFAFSRLNSDKPTYNISILLNKGE